MALSCRWTWKWFLGSSWNYYWIWHKHFILHWFCNFSLSRLTAYLGVAKINHQCIIDRNNLISIYIDMAFFKEMTLCIRIKSKGFLSLKHQSVSLEGMVCFTLSSPSYYYLNMHESVLNACNVIHKNSFSWLRVHSRPTNSQQSTGKWPAVSWQVFSGSCSSQLPNFLQQEIPWSSSYLTDSFISFH